MTEDIIIIGGGISGLSCAYFLQKFAPNMSCRILEASGRIGGSIATCILNSGQLYESGPRSLRFRDKSSTAAYELIESLDLTQNLIRSSAEANIRYVILDGEPVPLPYNLYSLFATSIGRHLLTKTILEPFQPPSYIEDESVDSFFSRRAPSSIISKLVDALCSGIWGGDSKNLSIQGTFPELKNTELVFGSVIKGQIAAFASKKTQPKIRGIYSLKEGLGSLVQALKNNLNAPIHIHSKATSIQLHDNAVTIHTPSHTYRAKKIVMAIPEIVMRNLYAPLFNIQTPLASFASVVMGFKNASISKKGYGILAPSTEDPHVLGILFDSCVFPEQNSSMNTRLSVIIGGARWPRVIQAQEEDIYSIAKKAVSSWIGIKDTPDEQAVIRSDNAIPQMPIGCQPLQPYRISKNGEVLAIGPSIGGVSINQCIAGAHAAATHLATTTLR